MLRELRSPASWHGTSHDVCLIESGALAVDEATQSLYDLQSVGYPVRDNFMARARYFGGSSNLWAGRSHAARTHRFQRRDWVPDSGWPILMPTSELLPKSRAGARAAGGRPAKRQGRGGLYERKR